MATYTTRQRKAVLDCLAERADAPVSASAIVERLRERGERIGTATVYRQLERLERQGHIHKAVTEEGAFYRYCEHESSGGCFLMKCERCGRIEHVDCEQLEPLYEHLEWEHGFAVDPRRTMLYGTCARCLKQAREART